MLNALATGEKKCKGTQEIFVMDLFIILHAVMVSQVYAHNINSSKCIQ